MARPCKVLRSATKLKLEQILRFDLLGRKPKEIASLMGNEKSPRFATRSIPLPCLRRNWKGATVGF